MLEVTLASRVKGMALEPGPALLSNSSGYQSVAMLPKPVGGDQDNDRDDLPPPIFEPTSFQQMHCRSHGDVPYKPPPPHYAQYSHFQSVIPIDYNYGVPIPTFTEAPHHSMGRKDIQQHASARVQGKYMYIGLISNVPLHSGQQLVISTPMFYIHTRTCTEH